MFFCYVRGASDPRFSFGTVLCDVPQSIPLWSNSRGYFPALLSAWLPPLSISRDSILAPLLFLAFMRAHSCAHFPFGVPRFRYSGIPFFFCPIIDHF